MYEHYKNILFNYTKVPKQIKRFYDMNYIKKFGFEKN